MEKPTYFLFSAKDQKNRELFEKVFPEIKKDREERERNERHERNNTDDALPKSKEEAIYYILF